MVLPNAFQTESRVNANYDYNDIVSGLGYIKFYPTIAKTSDMNHSILADTTLCGVPTGGTITGNTYTFDFISSKFNTQRIINGTAYLGSYVYQPMQVTASLYDINFDSVSVGSSVVSDATDNTLGSGSGFQVVATLTANAYCYHTILKAYLTGGGAASASVRVRYIYTDGTSAYSTETPSVNYVQTDYTLTNPYNYKVVQSVEFQGERSGDTLHLKDKNVYGITGQIENTIASSVTSNNITGGDGTFLIPFNITNYKMAIGRKLKLRIYLSGTGGLTCDPLNSILATETLKLDIPFKISL